MNKNWRSWPTQQNVQGRSGPMANCPSPCRCVIWRPVGLILVELREAFWKRWLPCRDMKVMLQQEGEKAFPGDRKITRKTWSKLTHFKKFLFPLTFISYWVPVSDTELWSVWDSGRFTFNILLWIALAPGILEFKLCKLQSYWLSMQFITFLPLSSNCFSVFYSTIHS